MFNKIFFSFVMLSFILISQTSFSDPKKIQIPLSDYKQFALSSRASGLDPKTSENRRRLRDGLGTLPTIWGEGEGYAQVRSTAINANLNVPHGWEALEDGKKLRIFTPDSDVLIIVNWVDTSTYGGWEGFKQKFLQQSSYDFSQQKKDNKNMKLEQFILDESSFGHKITHVQGEFEEYSLMTFLKSLPEKNGNALRLNLTAPPEKLDQYIPLLGLLMKDVKVAGSVQ
ncbi:MAG: hypothetical protein JNK65_00640 [Deltaproteobacteria bacterium]|nr:hypothetical protein [Deltaproteobacteria bacterium]